MAATDQQKTAIVSLVKDGKLDFKQIAKQVGVSPGTVASIKAHMTMGTYGEARKIEHKRPFVTQSAPAAFFSYSREDSEFALRLAVDLKTAGANVWVDRMDIIPGQLWDHAVEDALTKCPRMVVILSPASIKSTNVMDEVSFALQAKKTVIPVIYKDCTVPLRLHRVQYVDFRLDYARGLKELLKTLLSLEQSTPATKIQELETQQSSAQGPENFESATPKRVIPGNASDFPAAPHIVRLLKERGAHSKGQAVDRKWLDGQLINKVAGVKTHQAVSFGLIKLRGDGVIEYEGKPIRVWLK